MKKVEGREEEEEVEVEIKVEDKIHSKNLLL